MDFAVGDAAAFSRTITETDFTIFAGLSGDYNPIHVDKEYARETFFGERISHGLLTASFLSRLLGMHLPGPGSVYVSQTLTFKKPVYIGDTITARAEVIKVEDEKRLLTLATTCLNQHGEIVLDGEGVMKLPKKERNR
ncbi:MULTISPECIES: MaoC family dehydratase [Oceanobacillus]|uniref:Enoyl-CoA hydratase n=1 Tax=Oceanobacillus profundus TaxID=372463 RepID=A0A417YC39_9BACI|nr:MaoC family dehydratase [Oceanobacillus profundus]PAE28052.1 enoyl-CoA hydratase [Paenibacillus sp. 7884-2]RHW30064.1 enoyl-CoA hydratase [Oceanobacillus profundus]